MIIVTPCDKIIEKRCGRTDQNLKMTGNSREEIALKNQTKFHDSICTIVENKNPITKIILYRTYYSTLTSNHDNSFPHGSTFATSHLQNTSTNLNSCTMFAPVYFESFATLVEAQQAASKILSCRTTLFHQDILKIEDDLTLDHFFDFSFTSNTSHKLSIIKEEIIKHSLEGQLTTKQSFGSESKITYSEIHNETRKNPSYSEILPIVQQKRKEDMTAFLKIKNALVSSREKFDSKANVRVNSKIYHAANNGYKKELKNSNQNPTGVLPSSIVKHPGPNSTQNSMLSNIFTGVSSKITSGIKSLIKYGK